MKVLGLTGGIGSGKTTVANILESKGIPVYYSDDRAKFLMNNSDFIKAKLIEVFGKEVYINEKLNRKFLSNLVFNNKNQLNRLNSIIHPVIAKDFNDWKNKNNAKFVVKEAAILFESGAYKSCDLNININSNINDRLKRVMKRDSSTKEEVMARINNQFTDIEREKLSDFTITNDDFSKLEEKVLTLITTIKTKH